MASRIEYLKTTTERTAHKVLSLSRQLGDFHEILIAFNEYQKELQRRQNTVQNVVIELGRRVRELQKD